MSVRSNRLGHSLTQTQHFQSAVRSSKMDDYLEDEIDPSVLERLPWYETPLDASKHCIRLLTLHPGRGDETLACDLFVVSLDDKPEYETLSYVWGDPGQTRAITVAGTRFDATVNLADFLQCLRLPNAARTLWADAVCIDQRSVQEKSHQAPNSNRASGRMTSKQSRAGLVEAEPLGDKSRAARHHT